MDDDLIYDVGVHTGEDTDYYLRKGFRVVGVEANPGLVVALKERFAGDIDDRRLTLVDKAIGASRGVVDFYVNRYVSEWGTTDHDWMSRNAKVGAPSDVVRVPTVSLGELLDSFGVPRYMKIDIEGADRLCLRELARRADAPRYVSVESHAWDYEETLEDLEILGAAGYRKFKVIAQHTIDRQVCPRPAKEGRYVRHDFPPGASGLFGEELPGTWMTLEMAKRRYRTLYARVRMVGRHNGVLRFVTNRYLVAALARLFPGGTGWFDTHATF